jgi:hypothetical protein
MAELNVPSENENDFMKVWGDSILYCPFGNWRLKGRGSLFTLAFHPYKTQFIWEL